MKLTDGKKTVEIRLQTWTGSEYTPDWSLDFFEAGGLPYNDETDTYTVPDVDYCIEQAEDWQHSRGDYADDEPNEGNMVFVDEIQPPKSYHIRPEYLHLWGSECTEETVIDERELRRLSGEWGISVDELAEQLVEIQ